MGIVLPCGDGEIAAATDTVGDKADSFCPRSVSGLDLFRAGRAYRGVDRGKSRNETPPPVEVIVRILSALLVIWFVIGAIAAGQRHYYSGGASNCAHTGTIVVTILAGPLNYVGANPKVTSCSIPKPSK